MEGILVAHRLLGERVLPPLILIAAIWFSVTWKPDGGRSLPARLFPILVDIEVTLGVVSWIYLLSLGATHILQAPFIVHPILGLLAVGAAHLAVGTRNPFRRLKRWSP
jgi:hypothetical protein